MRSIPSIISILSILCSLLDPGGYLVRGLAATCHQSISAWVMARPQAELSVSEEVLVIQMEFFQAGAGHLGELELHFFGCGAGLAAFSDVLHAAAGGLDHLVVGAAAPVDVAITKTDGHVVDQLGELETFEFPVASVGGEEWVVGHGEGQYARGVVPLSCG